MYLSSQPSDKLLGTPTTGGLSITSIDVNSNYNNLKIDSLNPQTLEALNFVKDQQKITEEYLINNTSVCDIPMLTALRDHIGGLQANKLKNYSINQLQNPKAMEATMCTTDSIFYTSPYDIGSLQLNNRIRMYIHNLRQIGSESADAYALVGDFEDAKDMFVIKVPRNPSDDSLLHELIVGLYGTNKLRQYIPNFSYIYGGFKCSPPLIDPETKKVVTWCLHNDNPVNYILYENISPAISLAKYIENCSGKEFLNVYMQILYSERLALKLIDFTHYDLHFENVLIRDIPNNNNNTSYQIPYETEHGIEYITAKIIATIIDYGNSHIKTGILFDKFGQLISEERHYGKNGLVPFSIFSYRSWIMHDLYKLLMFCMMGAIRSNNQSVLNETIKIFRFFNKTEDPILAVNSQFDSRFALPLNQITNSLSIGDLASYIRLTCDCSFIGPKDNDILTLNCETICVTESTILTNIGINPNMPIAIPDNILEFYDIIVRLQNENKIEEKQQIGDNFQYNQAINNHIDKMNDIMNELSKLRAKLKLINLVDMNLDNILQYNTMMIVRSMYISVGSLVDKTVELRFYYDVGTAVSRSYEDNISIGVMDKIIDNFNKNIKPGLDDAKSVLNSNDLYLNQIQTDQIVITAISQDQRLRWYWDGRQIYDKIFGNILIETQIIIYDNTVL